MQTIYTCRLIESTHPLQLYIATILSVARSTQILRMEIRWLNNFVLQTLSGLNYYKHLATCNWAKYNINAPHMSEFKRTL